MILRTLSLTLLSTLLAAFSGCASDNPGITPSTARFYFPTGLALDPTPTRHLLYVSNSNADLRYNGGTLMLLDLSKLPTDLDKVSDAVQAGTLDCQPDRIDPSRWECEERPFIRANTTLRIGDFPGEVRTSADGTRVFVAARGRTEVVWADVVPSGDSARLQCNDSPEPTCSPDADNCAVVDCDLDHVINYSPLLEDTLPSEPFGIRYHALQAVHIDTDGRRRTCTDGVSTVPCDCGSTPECDETLTVGCCEPRPDVDHVYLAHLSGGEVSLLLSSDAGVELVHYQGGFFNSRGGIRGGFAIAPSVPGDARSPIFVSSRVDSALASFVVEAERIVRVRRVGLGALSPGDDVRGIAFGPGGNVIYAIDRAPSTLVAVKLRDDDGQPINEPLWTTEVCAEPSILKLAKDPEDAQTMLAYVVCFADKVIFVIDTETGAVRGRILTGDGPNGFEIDAANKRAFVANFAEQTVGVIDLDPTHASYRRMVLRIGKVELVE
ncbi:MAG: hypothetical protein KC503_12980 [Myxococcales bacterium]|nr:hypothetical protein [Myxococcales bacterium]